MVNRYKWVGKFSTVCNRGLPSISCQRVAASLIEELWAECVRPIALGETQYIHALCFIRVLWAPVKHCVSLTIVLEAGLNGSLFQGTNLNRTMVHWIHSFV